MNELFWLLALFFFLGTFTLAAFSSALRRLQKRHTIKEFDLMGNLFFYRRLHNFFFDNHEYEGISFSALAAMNICRFFFSLSAVALIFIYAGEQRVPFAIFTLIALFIVVFLTDYLPRVLGNLYAKGCLWFLAPLASLFLLIAFPFTYLFMQISRLFVHSATFDYLHEPIPEAKQEIIDIIQESVQDKKLEPQDKKLIQAVFNFQNLIVREVMVPRVDLFGLTCELSVKEAATKLEQEGYSRIPVYKGSIDHILGVLMYKDVLSKYMEASLKGDPKILDQSIETIIKPVFYTPETKKISHLLQEFRRRQLHLAIVVDEYGGTEGIVTIEDILEEIVGDIEDEYDEEEALFTSLADGSFLVDARMNLFDLEEKLGIKLPEAGDYDTLGGYIFHKAGEIPTRGFMIKLDDVTLEVLRAGERNIEKVKIKRTSSSSSQ